MDLEPLYTLVSVWTERAEKEIAMLTGQRVGSELSFERVVNQAIENSGRAGAAFGMGSCAFDLELVLAKIAASLESNK